MTASPTTPTEQQLVTEILDRLSGERMMHDVTEIAQYVRLAGTPEEAKAFDYIESELAALGLEPQRALCDALVSLPGPASLTLIGDSPLTVECITHSMAATTPADGVTGPARFLGRGTRDDFAADVRGCVVFVDSLVSPGICARAQAAGAAAVVFVGDDHLHQGIISSLYGSPSSRTADDLPDCVAVSIRHADGETIRAAAGPDGSGPATVTVTASVDTGWRDLPLVTADLVPDDGDGTFAFFGVHVDSWDVGATDNGAGNAILLELARAFTAKRSQLRRGIRFLFWSGHSHGRYAGSCWYVDHHWLDLHEHAVIAMSIDSPGTKGAHALGGAKVMDEAVAIATEVAELVVGTEVPAPSRPPGGEQPLWRVGVPSMNPVRWRHSAGSEFSLSFQPTSPWWHHTVADTIDKVDPGVLLADARIYAAGLARFVVDAVLPLDYQAVARAVAEHLRALPSVIDLDPLVEAAATLEAAVAAMHQDAPADINDRLRRLGRELIPALYTTGDLFEPDDTAQKGFVPGLNAASRAADLPRDSFTFHALRTELVREANRVLYALTSATRVATGL